MARLILVRHGRAAAGWGEAADPGLDAVGRAQAAAMADGLVAAMAGAGPLPLVTSPLRRTRETAAALEQRWSIAAAVDPAVGEIPTPGGPGAPGEAPADRAVWLRGLLAATWDDHALPGWLAEWRDGVVGALVSLPGDTVVVTHFVAINTAVGAATGDRRLTCFHPDHCSRTVVDTAGGRLRLVERGAEAATVVR